MQSESSNTLRMRVPLAIGDRACNTDEAGAMAVVPKKKRVCNRRKGRYLEASLI